VTMPSDILIDQYRGGDVARLVDAIGARIDTRLREPLAELGEQLNLNVTDVWLDRIGQRLGLARPLVATGKFFGFDNAGVAFDQSPFSDPAARHASRIGVADRYYRRMLRARARFILGGADGETVAEILDILYDNGRIEDDGTMDVTLHIPRDADTVLQVAVAANIDEIIPRAVGVAYTVVADL